jgi:hypothetical protein
MNVTGRTFILLLAVLASGCGAGFRPFELRDIVWQDHDARPFGPKPPEIYNPPRWDLIDNTLFRPASEFFLFRPGSPRAINANALDEVPESTWFTNRLGMHPMSDEDLARGACPRDEAPPLPWIVTRGKNTGSSPGVVLTAADGRTYVFKIDFAGQPERATAADAVSTRMLYAAGYNVPCDIVVSFTRDNFRIQPGARVSGTGALYTEADLDNLLQHAMMNPDGTRRGSVSLFLEGDVLGGWRFSGVSEGDPNDIVPHEDRRDVRGLYVLSAWMNHVDARAENNMSMWVDAGGGLGYVRHYVLDAGDSFGIVWEDDMAWGLAQRFGHSNYFDVEQVVEDFLTLDIIPRPYRDARHGSQFDIFGFYDADRFVADQWRNGYPNPAFDRRTEQDCAWGARILSQFDPHRIRVLARTGHFSRPETEDEFVRILLERRRRILERWLTRISPLSEPALEGRELCMHDLAVESGTRDQRTRHYSTRLYSGVPPRAIAAVPIHAGNGRVCITLPDHRAAQPEYRIVDLRATSGEDHTAPARVHLYQLPNGEYRVVGLERPNTDQPDW